MTVSDWLKNSGSVSGNLTDESILKEIKNVKGDETFTKNGDQLTWNTDGRRYLLSGNNRSGTSGFCKAYLLSGRQRSQTGRSEGKKRTSEDSGGLYK